MSAGPIAIQRCRQCSQNLMGLPEVGECPKCGTGYHLDPPPVDQPVASIELGRHDRVAMTKLIILGALVPFLWLLSYGIMWGVATLVQFHYGGFFFHGHGANWPPHVVAAVGMVGLVYEGYRGVGNLFDPNDYVDSWAGIEAENAAVAYRMGFVLTFAWIVRQTLLVAPLATVKAIEARRSLARLNDAQIAQAQDLLDDLRKRNDWRPLSSIKSDPAVIMGLFKAQLVWIREREDVMEVRIDPSWIE